MASPKLLTPCLLILWLGLPTAAFSNPLLLLNQFFEPSDSLKNIELNRLPEGFYNLQQQMQQYNSCMGDFDLDNLEALQRDASVVKTRIEALCTEGRQDEAQTYADVVMRRLDKNPETAKLKKCAGQLLAGMNLQQLLDNTKNLPVCEQLTLLPF